MAALFSAPVSREGSKDGLRITIPSRVVRGPLRPFAPPGWLRVTIGGGRPFFAYARRPQSRASVDITLARSRFEVPVGTTVFGMLEDARPYRAADRPPVQGRHDWLPFVDADRYFPVDDGADLVIHVRHGNPFRLRRVVDAEPTYWLLGLYQAEGNKSSYEVAMGSTNRHMLAEFVGQIEAAWGISRARMYLRVLTVPGDDGAAYDRIGVRVAGRRPKVRKGNDNAAAEVHLSESMPMQRLVAAALAQIFSGGGTFPSREAARAYAIGWLDGDGTIVIQRGAITLRLAGYQHEQEVTLAALDLGFGWVPSTAKYGGLRHSTGRSINMRESAEFAAAGGMRFSMSRARLLYALENRLGRWRGIGRITAADVAEARRIFVRRLAAEVDRLRFVCPLESMRVGAKGVTYPLL